MSTACPQTIHSCSFKLSGDLLLINFEIIFSRDIAVKSMLFNQESIWRIKHASQMGFVIGCKHEVQFSFNMKYSKKIFIKTNAVFLKTTREKINF